MNTINTETIIIPSYNRINKVFDQFVKLTIYEKYGVLTTVISRWIDGEININGNLVNLNKLINSRTSFLQSTYGLSENTCIPVRRFLLTPNDETVTIYDPKNICVYYPEQLRNLFFALYQNSKNNVPLSYFGYITDVDVVNEDTEEDYDDFENSYYKNIDRLVNEYMEQGNHIESTSSMDKFTRELFSLTYLEIVEFMTYLFVMLPTVMQDDANFNYTMLSCNTEIMQQATREYMESFRDDIEEGLVELYKSENENDTSISTALEEDRPF